MVRSKTTSPVPLEIAPGVRVSLGRAAVRSVGEPPARDLGRYEVTHDPADRWRYRTPSLRNVARTAPYGSISTLRGVVEHYDRGGHPHDGLDPAIRPLGLEQEEIDDLVAFLESLTSSGLDELVADARSEEVGNPGRGVTQTWQPPSSSLGAEDPEERSRRSGEKQSRRPRPPPGVLRRLMAMSGSTSFALSSIAARVGPGFPATRATTVMVPEARGRWLARPAASTSGSRRSRDRRRR
jgi:hypothetical protein